MKVYEGESFADVYKPLLSDLLHNPEYETSPRGMAIKEFKNCALTINDPTKCLYSNPRRSSQEKYIAAELVWYFAGRNDTAFIKKYAKFWEQIANEDGTANSAYGNLIFASKNKYGYSQWEWAYNSLIQDFDTRQALLHFNTPDHQWSDNKDFVCTLNGIFHIRDGKLDFTLMMRSNDAILGLPTDIAFFGLLHQQMHKLLINAKYPDLKLGKYEHIVNSMHLYERNFELVQGMLDDDLFLDKEFPRIDTDFITENGQQTSKFRDLHDAVSLNDEEYQTGDELFSWIYKKISSNK